MIRVTIDLISAIHPDRDQRLGTMFITNDGTGTTEKRNYDVHVCRKGAEDMFGKPTRTGRVENYPAPSYNVWRLIARALLSAFPEEKVKCHIEHQRKNL